MGKKISAEIVADSINSNGDRITTFLLTYPRFIHGEIMTHRVFSRNSASSRAIPFEKMVKMVEEDPFIPIAWQKDHKGMQGTEYITNPDHINFRAVQWVNASKKAIMSAEELNGSITKKTSWDDIGEDVSEGITKQLVNRLLEPYMWHTCLVTATEFDNFFELRCPKYFISGVSGEVGTRRSAAVDDFITFRSWKDLLKYSGPYSVFNTATILDRIRNSNSQAEIHIQALAEAMWDTYNESTPELLKTGQYHTPFGDNMSDTKVLEYLVSDGDGSYGQKDYDEVKTQVSVARCARLSYMTFEGEIDYEKDVKLHDQLLESKHFSPFEHIAKCTDNVFDECGKDPLFEEGQTHIDSFGNLWSGNFKGWIQYRQLVQ